MIYLALICMFSLAIWCNKQRQDITELRERLTDIDKRCEEFRVKAYDANNRIDSVTASIPKNIYRLTDSLQRIDQSLTNNGLYDGLVNDPYLSESYVRLSIPFSMKALCNVVEILSSAGEFNPMHKAAGNYIDYRLSEVESEAIDWLNGDKND